MQKTEKEWAKGLKNKKRKQKTTEKRKEVKKVPAVGRNEVEGGLWVVGCGLWVSN